MVKVDFKNRIKDGVIWLLFFLYFRTNIVWVYSYFSSSATYEYLFLFLLAILVFFISTKSKFSLKNKDFLSKNTYFLLFSIITLDQVNVYFLHYQIISATAMLLFFYTILRLYLDEKTWKRGFYIFAIIALSLPFAEHIQTFLGFPIRLFTAKVVSTILGLLGHFNISNATVILTENAATSIDIPCSGIKSIYTGSLVFLILLFLKNSRLGLKILGIFIFYLLTLIFFNIWRVFSLVYIYDILNFPEFADTIHVGIGILSFIISTIILWKLLDKFADKKDEKVNKGLNKKTVKQKIKSQYIIVLLIFALVLDTAYISFLSDKNPIQLNNKEIVLNIENTKLTKVPFEAKEKEFFESKDIEFTGKYQGKTENNQNFSLLIVSSSSWKTHHNPEICIQGLGHKIDSSEIFQIGNFKVRKLSLNDGKDTIFYWFVNGEKNTIDYSERVWEGIKNPSEVWTLVEVGFTGDVDLENSEIQNLIIELQSNFTYIYL